MLGMVTPWAETKWCHPYLMSNKKGVSKKQKVFTKWCYPGP